MTTRPLAALLVLVATTCGCAAEPPADLVVRGADIHTADVERARARALAVREGRFVAVDEDLDDLVGPQTEVIDAGGASVVPGFIDAHVHFGSGQSLVRGVNLYGIASREEWLRRIEERAAELPEGTWILGGRWDHTLEEPVRWPTRQELDAAAPRHPVALSDVDGHSLWANSLALEIADIDASTPDPPGGRILRDGDTGEPTGIFLEAGGLVTRHVPELDGDERLAAQRETLEYASSLGITAAHDMAGLDTLDVYLELLRRDELPVRVWFGTYGGTDEVDELSAARERLLRDVRELGAEEELGPMLRLGFLKLMMDGVLSSRTAALLGPYTDAPDETGLPQYDLETLTEIVTAYNRAGFPVAIHAIGDLAVSRCLDAFAAARESVGEPPLPNRVEHNEVVDPDDAGRYAELRVIASMNPHHCITGIDKYNTLRLGPERVEWSFAWGRLRDAGADLMFGSDWATAPLDPLQQLYAAALRQKPEGGPPGGWHPDNRVSWDEALRGYTLAGARAAGWEDRIGSITPGKWADFVLLDARLPDPVDRSLLDRRVVATYLAGRRVHGD